MKSAKKSVIAILLLSICISLFIYIAGCTERLQETPVPITKPVPTPTPAMTHIPFSYTPTSPYFVLVDTGQHECYNNSEVINCPLPGGQFYGQDAQHKGNEPAYRDNGDGTITDLNTRLVWQKTPGPKVSFNEAVINSKIFELGGHTDWRLPTIKELYSLIVFSGTDPDPQSSSSSGLKPFIDTDYFDFEYGNTSAGERIIDAQYWSSTEYLGTTTDGNSTVFGVNFADGRIKGYPRDSGPKGQPMKEYVRYVRHEPYGFNDLIDNRDETVTDLATGLMWSKADSRKRMDWEDALAWVQQMNNENYLGYSDWRLPDAKELQSIVDYTRSPQENEKAAIDSVFKISAIVNEARERDHPYFWTSTTHINQRGDGSNAVYIAFGRAMGYWMGEWTDVHGAGAQRSDSKTGNPDDFPEGRGPQGDAIRILNYVRCVRDAE